MRAAILIFGALALVAIGLIAYGRFGPYYDTEPVQARLSLLSEGRQQFPFRVSRNEVYQIEVHLKNVLPVSEMNAIVGNFVAGDPGAIDIDWEVRSGGVLVAKGSSREFGYSPIFSDDYSGLTVGRFRAHRNREYLLNVTPHNPDPSWDDCEPRIEVGLHPAKLEYLMFYSFLGMGLILSVGPIFLILLTVNLVRSYAKGGMV